MAEKTFEEAMARLEQIVATLESGKCTLDESMTLFEEGAKLTAFCRKALDSAEQKIRRLQGETEPASEPKAEPKAEAEPSDEELPF